MNANQLVKIKPDTIPNDSRHTAWVDKSKPPINMDCLPSYINLGGQP